MDILICIGKLMMVTVMSRPPKWPLLGAGRAPTSQNELKNTACFVGSVGKIAVVSAGNGEHAGVIHEKAHENRGPAETGKNREYAHHMDQEKRDAIHPVNLFIMGVFVANMTPSNFRLFARVVCLPCLHES
jgi:hypothetical protein